jgi:hypothetical protein
MRQSNMQAERGARRSREDKPKAAGEIVRFGARRTPGFSCALLPRSGAGAA